MYLGDGVVLQQLHVGGEVVDQELVPDQADHGRGDVDQEVAASLVGQERVPQSENLGVGQDKAKLDKIRPN